MNNLDKSETDPVVLWAEIHKLREAVKGPSGYSTWQDAAVAERMLRIDAENKIAKYQSVKIVPSGWVAIPMDPTEEQWITAQGTLLDYNWDAVTCFAARLQTLISITRNQLEDEIKALNV